MRDQLQQAQEERDGHLKTICSLKQVSGPSVAPGISLGLSVQHGASKGCSAGSFGTCYLCPLYLTGGKGHSGWAADPGEEGQCCGKDGKVSKHSPVLAHLHPFPMGPLVLSP